MMGRREYTPHPIDTADQVLPPDIAELTEVMARNVHEVWAQTRLRQGWKHGVQRNDTLKEHPGLVEYDDLPQAEREYDRNTVISTLKLIGKMGYKIEKK